MNNRPRAEGKMEKVDIEKLKRLYVKATPGGWKLNVLTDAIGEQYPTQYSSWAFVEPSVCGLYADKGKNLSDAKLIAALHNTFPAMVAHVKDLEAKLELCKELAPTVEQELSDAEIGKAFYEGFPWNVDNIERCRAVIAAYRRKQK